jgi:phage gp36-like protein
VATIYIDKSTMILLFGEKELAQLTDRDGSTGAIVDTVLDRAMATAESEVNSYISAAYTLPLPSVPEILKTFTGDIARYYLYDESPTDQVSKRYERAVSWLHDVAKGVVNLGFPNTDDNPEAPTIVVVSSRTQVFSDNAFSKMGPTWPTL